MRVRSKVLPALVVAATATVVVSAQQMPGIRRPADQIFRATVEMVSLNVTVVDGQNRYVTDLDRGDFGVFEDGTKQEITYFNKTSLPIALSVLIDTSASMEQRLPTAQEAAVGFAKRLRPQDLAQIVDFDTRVEVLQDFTGDIAALESAIRLTQAGGSTSLHNAIYISLKELAKIRAKSEDDVRRRAIVLLSDGEDTSSLVNFEEVLDLAKRSETSIYAIGLQSRESGGLGKGFREAEFVLRQLAQETGGRSFFPASVHELPKIYEQISQELSTLYSIGYSSRNPSRNGAWRRIVVRVARPGMLARTRQGYYGPTAP